MDARDVEGTVEVKSVNKSDAGTRPGRVTHCCYEHAGQSFRSLTGSPGIRLIHLHCLRRRVDGTEEEGARGDPRPGV
jgi:hypothetical protein